MVIEGTRLMETWDVLKCHYGEQAFLENWRLMETWDVLKSKWLQYGHRRNAINGNMGCIEIGGTAGFFHLGRRLMETWDVLKFDTTYFNREAIID